MRVAAIGLGDIARKAYLPVLAARADVEPVLVTRDPETLAGLGDAYRIERRHRDLEAALAGGIDAAFVHAATAVHPILVETLLRAGIPTYVDKPLADNLAEAERLVRLAQAVGGSLLVGFNRRFAPCYAALAEAPRDLILFQKNRVGLPDTPRSVVFDDFIHVVDTLRFLAPGPVEHSDIRVRRRDGMLHHVSLELSGEGFTAIGIMNRVSGANEEVLEVMGAGAKRRIVNMAEVTDYRGGEVLTRRGDWVSVAEQRGIRGIVDHFLAGVASGRRFDPAEALATHAICERIVAVAEAS